MMLSASPLHEDPWAAGATFAMARSPATQVSREWVQ